MGSGVGMRQWRVMEGGRMWGPGEGGQVPLLPTEHFHLSKALETNTVRLVKTEHSRRATRAH